MALQDGLLSFTIKETIFLSSDKAGIGELQELELVPDVEILENESYISITGCLQLYGKYEPIRDTAESNSGGTETLIQAMTFAPFQRDTAESPGYSWEEQIGHRIPLNITIPVERIADVNDIYAIVDGFDYKLESPHQMLIEAELKLGGIQFSDLAEADQPQAGAELAHMAETEEQSLHESWEFSHVAIEEENRDESQEPASLEEIDEKLTRLEQEMELQGRHAGSRYTESGDVHATYAESADRNARYSNYTDSDSVYTDSANTDSTYTESADLYSAYADDPANTDSTHGDSVYTDSTYSDSESTYSDSAYSDSVYTESADVYSAYTESANADSTYAESAHVHAPYTESADADSTFADAMNTDSADLFNIPALPASAQYSQSYGELTEMEETAQETDSGESSFYERTAANADYQEQWTEEVPPSQGADEPVVAIHDMDSPTVGFTSAQHVDSAAQPKAAQEENVVINEVRYSEESHASSSLQQKEIQEVVSGPQREESQEVAASPQQEEVQEVVASPQQEEIYESAGSQSEESNEEAVEAAAEVQAQEEASEEQAEVRVAISGKPMREDGGSLNITSIFSQASRARQEAEASEEQSSSSSSRKGSSETVSASTLEAVQNLTSFVRNREERSSQMKLCIIQREETLEQISQRYSLPVSKLLEVNRLSPNDQLVAGQILYIPQ